jgi:hypothetical protein
MLVINSMLQHAVKALSEASEAAVSNGGDDPGNY